jgi:hypothetical protein
MAEFILYCSGQEFLILGSSHVISNPDIESERKLLTQLAPEVNEDLVARLINAFHDLRQGYENGSLIYPYSLRGAHHIFYIY